MVEALRAVIIGAVVGAAFCAVLLCAFSFAFVSAENIPHSFLPSFVIVISVVSSFLAGWVTAKISGKRGLVYGALSGLLLFALFVAGGLITSGEGLSAVSGVRLFVMLISGALGGFISVNKRTKIK